MPIELTSKDAASAGFAALSICESILLSLVANGTIKEEEAAAILDDAASAHREAALVPGTPPFHDTTAALIQSIADNGNSVRRLHRDENGVVDDPTMS